MDDVDKKSEDEAAEPAPDAAKDEGAELRKVSEDELKQILAAHETWLETDGEEGKRADLSRTDLQGADLVVANLQKAHLSDLPRSGTPDGHDPGHSSRNWKPISSKPVPARSGSSRRWSI